MQTTRIVIKQPRNVEPLDGTLPFAAIVPVCASDRGEPSEIGMQARKADHIIAPFRKFFWSPTAPVPLFWTLCRFGMGFRILTVKAVWREYANGVSFTLQRVKKFAALVSLEVLDHIQQCDKAPGQRRLVHMVSDVCINKACWLVRPIVNVNAYSLDGFGNSDSSGCFCRAATQIDPLRKTASVPQRWIQQQNTMRARRTRKGSEYAALGFSVDHGRKV
jgi:hypothetical protein